MGQSRAQDRWVGPCWAWMLETIPVEDSDCIFVVFC